MSNVRETSIETYKEIEYEGVRQNREDLVYNYIKNNNGLTGREIAYGLGFNDMNEVRPRISDLFNKGLILYGEKRLSEGSERPSAEVWLISEFEEKFLNKLGFQKKSERLYYFETVDFILYQDFRGNKRKSYAFNIEGKQINYKDLWIHKAFKQLLLNNRSW